MLFDVMYVLTLLLPTIKAEPFEYNKLYVRLDELTTREPFATSRPFFTIKFVIRIHFPSGVVLLRVFSNILPQL